MPIAYILAALTLATHAALPPGWTNHGKPTFTEKVATRHGARYYVGCTQGAIASTADTGRSWQHHFMPTDSAIISFMVVQNSLLAFAMDGSFARTSDGTTWKHDTIAPGKVIRAVAWNDSEALAIATTGEAYRSTDFETWSAQPETAPTSLNCMTHDGTRWVALTDNGASWSSEDGRTWQRISQIGPTKAEQLIAFRGLYVARNSNSLQESSDLRDWQEKNNFRRAHVAQDTLYTFGSAGNVAITGDGENWTTFTQTNIGTSLYYERSGPVSVSIRSDEDVMVSRTATDAGERRYMPYPYNMNLTNCGGRLVGFDSRHVQFGFLPDTSKWNYRTGTGIWNLTCNDSIVVVFEQMADSILAGRAGTWIRSPAPGTRDMRIQQGTWTGTEFAAVGTQGYIYYSAGTWKDGRGLAWSNPVRAHSVASVEYALAASDSVLVVVGDGRVTRFVDWVRDTTKSVRLPFTYNNGLVAWGNKRFVRLGDDSAVSVSADGITWSSHLDSKTHGVTSLAFLGGRFYATTGKGLLVSSDSGTTWTIEAQFDWSTYSVTLVGDTLVVSSGSMLATKRIKHTPPVGIAPSAKPGRAASLRMDSRGLLLLPEGIDHLTILDARGRAIARLQGHDGTITLPNHLAGSGRLFAAWSEGATRKAAPLLLVR